MANQERGEVSLDVKGKRYTLRPTLNSICEMEELTGKGFAEIGVAAEKGRLTALRAMVWAYLQECHADEIKTLRDAGDLIQDAGGLDVINERLKALLVSNAPPPDHRAPEEGRTNGARPHRARSGATGRRSSRTPVGTSS